MTPAAGDRTCSIPDRSDADLRVRQGHRQRRRILGRHIPHAGTPRHRAGEFEKGARAISARGGRSVPVRSTRARTVAGTAGGRLFNVVMAVDSSAGSTTAIPPPSGVPWQQRRPRARHWRIRSGRWPGTHQRDQNSPRVQQHSPRLPQCSQAYPSRPARSPEPPGTHPRTSHPARQGIHRIGTDIAVHLTERLRGVDRQGASTGDTSRPYRRSVERRRGGWPHRWWTRAGRRRRSSASAASTSTRPSGSVSNRWTRNPLAAMAVRFGPYSPAGRASVRSPATRTEAGPARDQAGGGTRRRRRTAR